MPLQSTGPISLQDVDTFFNHNSDTSGKIQIEEYYGAAPSWSIPLSGVNGPVSMSAYRGKDIPTTLTFRMDSTSSISTVLDDVRTYKNGVSNSPNWATISQSEWDGLTSSLGRLAYTRAADEGTGNPDKDGRRRISNTSTQTGETTMPWWWGEIRIGTGSGYTKHLCCSSRFKALLKHYPTLTIRWRNDGDALDSETVINNLNSTNWAESRVTGFITTQDHQSYVTYLSTNTLNPDFRGIIEGGGTGFVEVKLSGRT